MFALIKDIETSW